MAAQHQAMIDLLGVVAYGELTAFERLAADARLALTLSEKAALGEMAVAEFGHYGRLAARLASLGADPEAAMAPFVRLIEDFHRRTAPSSLLESLVKFYIGDGIEADFYREVAALLDARTRALVLEVLADAGHASFAVAKVRAAIEAEPAYAGRLALWARRLVGETLRQAQRLTAEHDALLELVVGGHDLSELGILFARITVGHDERMARLGLSL